MVHMKADSFPRITIPVHPDIRLVASLNRQSVARVVLDAQEDYLKYNAATVKLARKTFKQPAK